MSATAGNRHDVGSSFDSRRKANTGEVTALNEGGEGAGSEPDMFGEGVAAE